MGIRSIWKTAFVGAGLAWAASAGGQEGQPVVAVGDLKSSYRVPDSQAARAALEASLSETGKVAVMARAQLDEMLTERGVSVSDVARGKAPLDESSGVDYLVTGAIAEAEVVADKGDRGSLLGQLIGSGGCHAVVSIDARLVNVRTGQLRVSENLAASESIHVDFPKDGDFSDPCGRANDVEKQSALNSAGSRAARLIAEQVTVDLFPIKLVGAHDNDVFLNYGSSLLSAGQHLRVVAVGEGFVDPDTGETLGAHEEELGYVVVAEAQDKYSRATVAFAGSPLAVGNVARRLSEQETKRVRKMLSDRARSEARQERACENARKRAERGCGHDETSNRCARARAAVAKDCG